ncbi:MAG: phytoene desaturase [Gemmatimonadetes bacterium]|nr:phytoene desaturase [Gemmatimonadota bacterium]
MSVPVTRTDKTIAIVGAGPGGLTAAMILARRGYRVRVFEKDVQVGGRNAALRAGDFTFDTGPTFLMVPQILDEVFELAGARVQDHLELRRLDPLYRLQFGDRSEFLPSADHDETVRRIDALFPGEGAGYRRYLDHERRKIDAVFPCLRVPYDKPWHYLRLRLLKALPKLDLNKSVYDCVAQFFRHEHLRISFTFQAKYLGMSPWECPGTFSILSAFEHLFGIYHPIGGLFRISESMADVARGHGAEIHTASPVRRVLSRNGRATGLELASGERVDADAVVLGADFGYAMTQLLDAPDRGRFTDENVRQREYSCSTFMLYLGIDGGWDAAHHNIFFSDDYRSYVRDIGTGRLSRDPSFYVQNASVTDPTLAPTGSSTLYVLVPVPNNTSGMAWNADETAAFRETVLSKLESRTGLHGLCGRIREERIITPRDWESRANVYHGAVFNLAHTINQMLYFRPHNKFSELDRCYLVGGGTHPGSGLPTIYESGRIAADLILRDIH